MSSGNSSPKVSSLIDLTHTLSQTSTPIYPGDPSFNISPVYTHKEQGASIMKIEMGTHTGTHIDAPFHFLEEGQTVDQLDLAKDLLWKEGWIVDFTVPVRGKEAGLDLQERQRIEWEEIQPYLPKDLKDLHGKIVLFHTGWSKSFYNLAPSQSNAKYFAHPFLEANIAQHLLDLGVRIIGLDIPSPDETPAPTDDACSQDADVCPCPGPVLDASVKTAIATAYPFHVAFLSAGAVIVENMANLDLLAAAVRKSDQVRRSRWLISVVPLRLEGADGSPVRVFASLSESDNELLD